MSGSTPTQWSTRHVAPPPWPYCPLHGHPGYVDGWRKVFGAGLNYRVLELPAGRYPTITVRRRAPLELGQRFVTVPLDAEFVNEARRRIIPIRMIAPASALEAGNLRGSPILDSLPDTDMLQAIATELLRTGGWDIAQIPIPVTLACAAVAAIQGAGLSVVLRKTGRHFMGHIDYPGWETYARSISRNASKNHSRLDRKLQEVGAVVEMLASEQWDEGFKHLQHCADLSWKGYTGARGAEILVPLSARQLAFLKCLADQEGIEPVFFTLTQDGLYRAAMLFFRTKGWLVGSVTFYDPEVNDLSPGHAMLKAAMIWAGTEGIRNIDFNATDGWLRTYANASVEFCTMLVIRKGGLGQALKRLADRVSHTDEILDRARNTSALDE